MSGIYIKGMEMPKNCLLCQLSVLYEKPREALFCRILKEEVLRNKIDGSCPLVAVPDHGRLIDADAIDYDDYWWNRKYSAKECQQAERMVEEQPTIIPADKGGDVE